MENALSKLNKKQVENTEPLATLIRELSRICLVEGCFPQRIQCDNGSEFISKEMDLCGAARAGLFEWRNARLLKTRKTNGQPIC